MCGEHPPSCSMLIVELGSSPHVRGALRAGVCRNVGHGIIPACAGSTKKTHTPITLIRDHPRMCGEHVNIKLTIQRPQGSSPHVRGAHENGVIHNAELGIIPACAGSTGYCIFHYCSFRDHPRMCGEHGVYRNRMFLRRGSSPHVRGAPNRCSEHDALLGIIPACAGSTVFDDGC